MESAVTAWQPDLLWYYHYQNWNTYKYSRFKTIDFDKSKGREANAHEQIWTNREKSMWRNGAAPLTDIDIETERETLSSRWS